MFYDPRYDASRLVLPSQTEILSCIFAAPTNEEMADRAFLGGVWLQAFRSVARWPYGSPGERAIGETEALLRGAFLSLDKVRLSAAFLRKMARELRAMADAIEGMSG